MKSFYNYIKEKIKIILIYLFFTILLSVSFYLYDLPLSAIIYPCILCAMLGFFFLIIGSCKEKSKLDNIKKIEKCTEESLIFPAPQSEIEKEYQKIINLLQQETIKIKASSENDYKDMIEYYTFWAHQIKTPVASMKISLQNEDSEFSRKLRGDLFSY